MDDFFDECANGIGIQAQTDQQSWPNVKSESRGRKLSEI